MTTLREGVGYVPTSTTVRWVEQLPDGKLVDRQTQFRNTGPGANLNDKAQFEARYGVGTFSRKKFAAADNELFSPISLALGFLFGQGKLGSRSIYNGVPTQLEVTDAMATGEALALVRQYYVDADLPGVRKDNPQRVYDTSRPFGEVWTEKDKYWKLDLWYVNTAKGKPTVPPAPPKPPEPIPPTSGQLPEERAADLRDQLVRELSKIPNTQHSKTAVQIASMPFTYLVLCRAVELYRKVMS